MSEPVTRAWEEACWALGIRARRAAVDDLLARWSEPHRHYHGLCHLEACLALFEDHRDLAERPGEVLAALLFHDAIYDPTRADNEARSADLARAWLTEVRPDALDRVQAMILATRTHVPEGADAALVLDVDLAILGADPARYDGFERAIRAEYAHVPEEAYRAGRVAILAAFHARAPIFRTLPFREPLEAVAHANLARTIGLAQR